MISILKGRPILEKENLTIMVGGVGYGVSISTKSRTNIIGKSDVTLHIHTHVREDNIELFGFESLKEKELFSLLQSVSGIGPRTALAITDRGAEGLIKAVREADVKFFSSVPRVGKKTAQKIIIELKSKLGSLKELDLTPLDSFGQNVVDALTSLGFDETQSREVFEQINPENEDLQAVVAQAIKKLGQK